MRADPCVFFSPFGQFLSNSFAYEWEPCMCACIRAYVCMNVFIFEWIVLCVCFQSVWEIFIADIFLPRDFHSISCWDSGAPRTKDARSLHVTSLKLWWVGTTISASPPLFANRTTDILLWIEGYQDDGDDGSMRHWHFALVVTYDDQCRRWIKRMLITMGFIAFSVFKRVLLLFL